MFFSVHSFYTLVPSKFQFNCYLFIFTDNKTRLVLYHFWHVKENMNFPQGHWILTSLMISKSRAIDSYTIPTVDPQTVDSLRSAIKHKKPQAAVSSNIYKSHICMCLCLDQCIWLAGAQFLWVSMVQLVSIYSYLEYRYIHSRCNRASLFRDQQ